MDVVVGLDCGTSSTKAVSAGADARVRDVVSVGYPLLVPSPGWAELDPARLQLAALEALSGIAERSRARGDTVVGIAVSAAMHGLVPAGADGRPLGPLLTWADSRAAPQAAALHADGRAPGLHERTGTPVHAMSPLAKLLWMREQGFVAPRWYGVKELLLSALCGPVHAVDLSCATTTGLYDGRAGRWDDEALSCAGVAAHQLADVLPTTATLPLTTAALGLLAGLPVVVGAADGVLANLGTGAVRTEVAAVSLGTSGAVRRVVPQPSYDPRLFCYALTSEHWVVGGAVSNGGSVVRWAAHALGGPAREGQDADRLDAQLLEEASAVAAGSEGLLCLPYLLGERAPEWTAGLSGAYVGLRRDHGRPHLVRAAVEGVCQQLALVRDALGEPLVEVRATGGAVASPLWVEVLASALDLPVRTTGSPEGTALGAVLLGMHALGGLPDLTAAAELVPVHEAVAPDPEEAALYRRRRPLVDRSVRALSEVMAALAQQ